MQQNNNIFLNYAQGSKVEIEFYDEMLYFLNIQ